MVPCIITRSHHDLCSIPIHIRLQALLMSRITWRGHGTLTSNNHLRDQLTNLRFIMVRCRHLKDRGPICMMAKTYLHTQGKLLCKARLSRNGSLLVSPNTTYQKSGLMKMALNLHDLNNLVKEKNGPCRLHMTGIRKHWI